MDVSFSPRAWDEYQKWLAQDKKKFKRINEIIKDAMSHPGEGLGKPEKLKDNLSGYWSRRIDQENRFVYKVEGNMLYIAQLRFHY